MLPSPLQHPTLRDDLPRYPPLSQLLRVGSTTVPGPSGYGSSSVLGPVLYVASTQQLRTDTILPRDREPCLALDVNGFGLSPGYYIGRLAGSHNSLPVYEVVCCAPSGLTPAQLGSLLIALTPTQLAVLNNLNPCQLQTFTTLSVSQQQILTSALTATEISVFVNGMTATALQNAVATLNVIEIQTLVRTGTYTTTFTGGTQNNIVTGGNFIQVPTTAATTITGIAPGSTTTAQTLTLTNTGSNIISIPHLDAGSAATNQFQTSTGGTLSIDAGGSITFMYNPTLQKWVDVAVSKSVSSGTGTPGGADTNVQYNDGGNFGGDANLVWDKANQKLTVIGTGANSGIHVDGGIGDPTVDLADGAYSVVATGIAGAYAWIGGNGVGIQSAGDVIICDAGTETFRIFGETGASQGAAIADAAGGVVVDAEARAALNTLLSYMRLWGWVNT